MTTLLEKINQHLDITPDDFSRRVSSQLSKDYQYIGKNKYDFLENDETDDVEMVTGYLFKNIPSKVEFLVTLADNFYEVGLFEDGDIYEHVDNIGNSGDYIGESMNQLLENYSENSENSQENTSSEPIGLVALILDGIDKSPDTFSSRVLRQVNKDFNYIGRKDYDLNESDGREDYQPEIGHGYLFKYLPSNLDVLVTMTDNDYEVAIVEDDGYIHEHVEHLGTFGNGIGDAMVDLVEQFEDYLRLEKLESYVEMTQEMVETTDKRVKKNTM